ncbi:MAG: HemK2/MTQ2 family protein methyltransferase [Candidatus Pacearchaeota archaeon]
MSLVYEPAEDSFLLESVIPKYAKDKSVIDIGCGSGILARTAKSARAKSVIAVDINLEAIKLLKKQNISAIKSDLFSKVKGKFDLIICNPPYLPEDKDEDQESQKITTGGVRGDEFILRFLNSAVKHLAKGGTILLLVSSLTPKDRIIELLKKLNLKKKVIASKKVFFEHLIVWQIR